LVTLRFIYTRSHDLPSKTMKPWDDPGDWILSQERSRDSKGSVFTGLILQESDPVYHEVKVPVAFYKVVSVVDNVTGRLAVTAFEMDQTSVMPRSPERLCLKRRSVFRWIR
jgi:endonuclease G, mitochondrial